MMADESGLHAHSTQAEERGAALALLPVAATLDYYALPDSLQTQTFVQFAPQILAYLALALWASHNHSRIARLGLARDGLRRGLRWGLPMGLLLGLLNSVIILSVAPRLGYDISFLKGTPHAQIPFWVMVPWFIVAIAWFVEVNFRGFLLGRLATLESHLWRHETVRRFSPLALLISAMTFAFDPFMVNTFQHLHWIAVWDGLVWGAMWVRTRNLFITIIAHAVEVIVMYCAVRAALLP
jgi:membrane protease YdiL (CAAX protease family)